MTFEDPHRTQAHATHRPTRALVALVAVAVAALAMAASAMAVIEKPVNTTLPSISGTPQEGTTLKAKKGSWTGNGSIVYSYQWQRCEPELECTNIVSATTSEYTARFIDISSTLRVIVTATNSAGATAATSEKTAPVAAVAPKNTVLPAISGSAEEGQLLSVSNGTWSGTPAASYIYVWERCTASKHCTEITGVTGTSYRLMAADVGDTIRVEVTAVNAAGSRNVTSAPTATVTYGPPVALDFPAITGDLRQGGTLHASTGTWAGLGPIEYEYSWESCNAEASCTHATGSSYTLGSGDVGNTLKVLVTAHNSLGSASSSSTATPTILGESDDFAVGWGEDQRAQLGTPYRAGWEELPVTAEGESHISAISTGGSFTLELHEDGTLTAAGAGYYGSLGYGGRKATWEQGKTHVTVSGLSGVKAISTGAEYSLALMNDGTVKAWGNNGFGTLGNGHGGFEKETGENQLVPKDVKALDGAGVTAVASGGGDNYALLSSGKVMGWGRDDIGQLSVPWTVECMKKKTCEEGTKRPSEEVGHKETPQKCWTEIGPVACEKTPTTVMELEGGVEKPLEHVVQVSVGDQSTYALLESGEVVSWGTDSKGQLGQKLEPGPHTSWTRPGRVMVSETEPLKHVVAIEAGYNHGLALQEGGTVVGWGDNGGGQLGAVTSPCGKENKHGGGTWTCDRYATTLTALSGIDVTALAAGSSFSAVLSNEGRVYTVGTNTYGQLGLGPNCENEGGEMGYQGSCYSRVWTAVPGLEDVQAISAGLKDMTALVGSHGTPPLPVLDAEPGHLSTKLQWQLPSGETANRVSLRLWEHPGAEEIAEGAEGEGGEEEGEEEATGEPPTNVTLPGLRTIEYIEGEKHVVKNATAVGETLESSPGNWTGTAPLTYEYRWLRCKSSKCSAITPWVAGGEAKGEELLLNEEDAGFTFEAQVAARHEGEARGIATTAPSEIVKAEGEGRKTSAEYTNIEGLDGVFFNQLEGKPLEAAQYEYKLSSQGGPKTNKQRTFLVTPLP
jgi:alpha-tubulin suppressor-like RCC1 family protein